MRDIFLFAVDQRQALVIAVAALFGLMMGVFLNTVVDGISKRLQAQSGCEDSGKANRFMSFAGYFKEISFPVCMHCRQRVTVWHRIPVMGYLFLHGKCSACRASISRRVPFVELASGILSALLIWRFGLNLYGLSALLCLYFLIALAFIDIDTQLLPDCLTYPLLWCGLLVNLNCTFVSLENAVAGAVGGYLSFWFVSFLYKWITGKEGIGFGDIKLISALGAWFGVFVLLVVVALAAIISLVSGVAGIAFSLQEKDKPFPFGPYLTIASVIALFYNEQLMQIGLDFL